MLALNVVAILVALSGAWALRFAGDQAGSVARVSVGGALAAVPDTDEPGSRTLNILLVGADSGEGLDADDDRNIGRQGERNGDVIMIARLDEAAGTVALLALPRDLWVPVQLPGEATPVDRKINAAYGFGGAETLIQTITERYGIPIHHFVSVDFAGFADLVGAVGEVNVWFERASRDFNARTGASQTGFETDAGCHALGPDRALAYVRSRFYQTLGDDGVWRDDANSDLDRIARQQDFLRRLLRTAIDDGARNPTVFAGLVEAGLDAVVIDSELTPALLLDLGRTFRSFEPEELATYALPVELDRIGTTWVVLEVPDDADPVVALFRGVPADDPATVRVVVRPATADLDDTEVATRTAEIVEQLRGLGYAADPAAAVPELDLAAGGVSVRHADTSALPAAALAERLGGSTVEVVGLAPRTIEILVGPEPTTSADPGPDTSSTVPAPAVDGAPDLLAAADAAAACR